jgi:hypothetical protein
MKNYVPAIMFLLPYLVYANCDELRERIRKHENVCNFAEKATGVVGIAALVFSPATFGASNFATIVSAATAEWFCRQTDYLRSHLNRCNISTEYAFWSKAFNEQKRAERQEWVGKHVDQLTMFRESNINTVSWQYENHIRVFAYHCADQGVDILADENKKFVDYFLRKVKRKYDFDIQLAEDLYDKEVMQYFPEEQQTLSSPMAKRWSERRRVNKEFKTYEQIYGPIRDKCNIEEDQDVFYNFFIRP